MYLTSYIFCPTLNKANYKINVITPWYVSSTCPFGLNMLSRYLPDWRPTNHCRSRIMQLARWYLLDCSLAVPLRCRSADFFRIRNHIGEICPTRFPDWNASTFWSRRRPDRDSKSRVAESKKWYEISDLKRVRNVTFADQNCTSITAFVEYLRNWIVLCQIHRSGIVC